MSAPASAAVVVTHKIVFAAQPCAKWCRIALPNVHHQKVLILVIYLMGTGESKPECKIIRHEENRQPLHRVILQTLESHLSL